MKGSKLRFALVVVLLLATLAASALPGQKVLEKFSQGSAASSALEEVKPYYEVLAAYPALAASAAPAEPIVFDHSRARPAKGSLSALLASGSHGTATALHWPTGLAWVEWDIEVDREGLYELEIEYRAEPVTTSRDIERGLAIDGRQPFREAGNIVLQRLWRESGGVKTNYAGDEVWPEQAEVVRWNRIAVYDKSALYVNPLRFHLTAGRHTVRLSYIFEPVTLGDVAFRPVATYPTYAEYAARHGGAAAYRGEPIRFEAEDHVVEMNTAAVRRESEIDPAVSPRSLGPRKLNVFGGWRWKDGNQSISWKFSVPEDGLYAIGLKVLQQRGEGLPVYRRIEIDGEVPFAELVSYTFPYRDRWQMAVLGDGDTDYLFALARGEHVLTMTVTMGEIGDLSLSLQRDAAVLSSLLGKVFKLTGSEPDPNFDYEFETNIPEMMGQIAEIIGHLEDDLVTLERICTQRPEVSSLIASVKDTLELFVSDHYKMSSRLKDLRQTQSIMTSIHFDLIGSMLTVDYALVGEKTPAWFRGITSTFLQRAYTTLYNFVRSFTHDYNAVSGMLSATDSRYRPLNVWMGQGMEWAELLKGLADERFTPRTGIVLNVNIVPASTFQAQTGGYNILLLSLAAGKAPDVATEVLSSIPVEFAIRDTAVDLQRLDGFDEVAKRFLPECLVPLRYRGGTYGLPESMTAKLLFYRTDILDELGLRVPDTWDELCEEVLPVLYRNNLAFVLPPDFSTFLYQNGGSFYRDDGLRSALDTPEAFKAFRDFLFMYTGYGVDAVNQSFYEKFRTGEIPMAVGDHTSYMLMLCAAPEIAGKWAIAPLPGIRRADGTIDHSTGAQVLGGTSSQVIGITDYSAMIFKTRGTDVAGAWEFLRWLTSYDTQSRFCYSVEASMTTFARWWTSNLEAFTTIPWIPEHLAVMTEQWKWYREIPVVLGGYFTNRHLNNAWTRVVTMDQQPRDSLEYAVKEINLEMQRKQLEYGIRVGD